jgi:hypothetical protein
MNKDSFIPYSTYEDMLFVCFSIIGLARNHLGPTGEHPVHRLTQALLGSDDCEHRFCAVKSRNANSKEDFDQAMNRADNFDASRAFSMKAKGNSDTKAIYVEDLLGEIRRQTRPAKKQKTKK